MRKIKVTGVYSYKGHSVLQNGSVNITLKAKYSGITNSVQLLQMLNNDVNIHVKMATEKKPFTIGTFHIKSINFDDDGESIVKFNSLNDFVDIDGINRLITKDEFKVLFSANIEEEDDEGEGEEGEEE